MARTAKMSPEDRTARKWGITISMLIVLFVAILAGCTSLAQPVAVSNQTEIDRLDDRIAGLEAQLERLNTSLESQDLSSASPARLNTTPKAAATPLPQENVDEEPENLNLASSSDSGNTTILADWGKCSEPPADFENLPRKEINAALVGEWFHPIYDLDAYQSSNGYDGQWSWYHTLCLVQIEGGTFRNFENNDGRFVFRVNETQAMAAFVVMTTEQHRAQFMDGADQYESAMNIRILPGETVQIYNPRTGEMIDSPQVSQGGDLLIVTPSNGMVGVRFPINDPAASFEAMIWMGPDDRPNSNINRFDASNLTR